MSEHKHQEEHNNYDFVEKRRAILTQHDLEKITEIVFGGITRERHMNDHVWVGDRQKKEEKRTEFRDKIAQQAVGWGVITAIGAFGYILAVGLIKYIKQILQ